MSEKQRTDEFEQRLLDQVETLCTVALKLTGNPWDAERITRSVLLQAWHRRGQLEGIEGLKTELLKMLRQRFVRQRPDTRLNEVLWPPQASRSQTQERAASPPDGMFLRPRNAGLAAVL